MNFRDKLIAWDKLPVWRAALRADGQKTGRDEWLFRHSASGPRDVIWNRHAILGDALLVGVNGDGSARQLKGAGRPVNSETDRAAVLAALASVNGVCIFAEKTAVKFLAAARPDIYVKGGDYTPDTLNQEERRTVESAGGKIVILPFVPGKSTTALLEKISKL